MTRGRMIEGVGQISETNGARPLSRWVIDRSSGRPALRLAWSMADAAPVAEDEGRTSETTRREVAYPAVAHWAPQEHEAVTARPVSRWMIDRMSGRPALHFAWPVANAAPAAPSALVA